MCLYEDMIFSDNDLTCYSSFPLSLNSSTLTGFISATNQSSAGTCTVKL